MASTSEDTLDSGLWTACLDGDVERVRRLIAAGANIEWIGQGGMRPLAIAAYNNHVDVVRLLLDEGAKVDAVDKHNRSALIWVASFGYVATAQALLDHKADVSLQTKMTKSTPLIAATNTGRLDIVKLLVSKGASWKVANKDGLTALDIAKKENHEHLVQYLSSLDDSESQIRKALKTDMKILLKVTRMSIHGAPGSGKTCLQHLLLNEPPPLERASTGVVTPAVRACDSTVMQSGDCYTMRRVSEEEFVKHLAQRLKGKEEESLKQRSSTYPTHSPPLPPPPTRSRRSWKSYFTRGSTASPRSSPSRPSPPPPPPPTYSVHYDIVSLLPTESCPKEIYRAHWTFCIDSGGQAAFQDIAPPFLRLNSLNIITLRLIDELNGQPNNEFYIEDKRFLCPQRNGLTNLQMITNFARSLLSVSPSNVSLSQNPPTTPNLLVIGTYYDRVRECCETLEQKNLLLKEELKPYKDMCISTPQSDYIHPVNTLVEDGRSKVSSELNKIITLCNKSDEVEVPFRWFCFQLEITKKAKDRSFCVLSRSECLDIACSFEMESSMVESALSYFDSLGMLFYYPAVLPNIVFTHPKPLLKVLTKLVCLTFINDLTGLSSLNYSLRPGSHDKLKEYGLFDTELVKCLDNNFGTSFSTQDFIHLLLHLLIICKLPDSSHYMYFIPCVLPWLQLPLSVEMKSYYEKANSIALTFGNGSQPIPYGVFTALVNSLITDGSFSLITSDFKQYRNVIGLEYKEGGWVVLLDKTCFIEVAFSGLSGACPQVLSLVTSGLKKASTSCRYRLGSLEVIRTGFYSQDCRHVHFTNKASNGSITYSCSYEVFELTSREAFWFNKCQIVPADPDWLDLVDNSPFNYYAGTDYTCVVEALLHVANWDNLGLALNIPPGIIDCIKKTHRDNVGDCRKEVITKWMMNDDCASWRSLCAALRRDIVGCTNLAKSIGKKHPIKHAHQSTTVDTASPLESAFPQTTLHSIPLPPSLPTSNQFSRPVPVSQDESVISRTSGIYRDPYQEEGTGDTELV